MKIRLKRPARIRHEAGEIVEVSPAEASFLLSTDSAVLLPVGETADKKPTTKKKAAATK
jgi:hypothetical protein